MDLGFKLGLETKLIDQFLKILNLASISLNLRSVNCILLFYYYFLKIVGSTSVIVVWQVFSIVFFFYRKLNPFFTMQNKKQETSFWYFLKTK